MNRNASLALSAVSGVAVASLAKVLVPRIGGLTFTTPVHTRYVPMNEVAFWLVLALTAALVLFCAMRSRPSASENR